MKSKLVLWGTNAQDEKVLIAVALRTEENKIDIWTFPESEADEEFYQKMMREWRDGEGMEIPENHHHIVRDLSISESLLPDDLKVERTDVVQRAQTEWHFIVLSSKLHQAYESELGELKENISKLEKFDQGVWDGLREFWDKVQEQVRERNLFREHADGLRESINNLFSDMKGLRQKMDDEFERLSKETRNSFFEALDEIEKKIEGGSRLAGLFDDLKKLQRKFRESTFTKDDRSKVWEKLDTAFKNIKQKRFGSKSAEEGNSAYQRLKRRYDGLLSAIEKMEQSIKRDKSDLEFQQHKIDTTSGQLEAQLRQAKTLMIEERVNSKEEKLKEMNATKLELEKRLAAQKERDMRRAAQEAIKEKIAEDIKTAAEARVEDTEKLEKAAEEIAESKTTPSKKTKADKVAEESILDAVGTTLGESLSDMVDTIKAVTVVIGDKVEDTIEDLKEDFKEKVEELAGELKKKKEEPAAAEKAETTVEDDAGTVAEEASSVAEEVAEAVAEAAETAVAAAEEPANGREEITQTAAGEAENAVAEEEVEETVSSDNAGKA